ncbi:MAG: hypothetical protein ABR576_00120 [Thermoanaerobaculia bacterium]
MSEETETKPNDRYAFLMPVFLVDEASDSWLIEEAEARSGEVECFHCSGPPHTLIPFEEAIEVTGLMETDEGGVTLGMNGIVYALLKLRREALSGPRPAPLEVAR